MQRKEKLMPEPLALNTPAPDFSLNADDGQTVRLRDYRGKKNVVLVFYTRNNTPGWNRQLSSLRDDYGRFAALDTEIIAVNPATEEAHAKYSQKKGFNFSLLSDTALTTAEAYNVLKENGTSIKRTVYVIDKQGIVRFAERGMPADEKMLDVIHSQNMHTL